MAALTTTTGADRASATRELLDALRGAKAWFHEATRDLHLDHSRAAVAVLALLDAHGPARVSELADLARVDVSVISRQLHDLEAAGLAERRPDPDDGRAHLLRVTPAGARVLEEARSALESTIADRLERWSTPEVIDLAGRLRTLVADLRR